MFECIKYGKPINLLMVLLMLFYALMPGWSAASEAGYPVSEARTADNRQHPIRHAGSDFRGSAQLSIMDNPFCYSSSYTDSESGMCYGMDRYYSPELMTYITRGDSSDQNHYNCCNNNPVGKPITGKKWSYGTKLTIGLAAAGCIGFPALAGLAMFQGETNGFDMESIASIAGGSAGVLVIACLIIAVKAMKSQRFARYRINQIVEDFKEVRDVHAKQYPQLYSSETMDRLMTEAGAEIDEIAEGKGLESEVAAARGQIGLGPAVEPEIALPPTVGGEADGDVSSIECVQDENDNRPESPEEKLDLNNEIIRTNSTGTAVVHNGVSSVSQNRSPASSPAASESPATVVANHVDEFHNVDHEGIRAGAKYI